MNCATCGVRKRHRRRKEAVMIAVLAPLLVHAVRALLARRAGPEIQPLPPLEAPPVPYEPPAPPLCYGCVFAQVTRGRALDEEAVFCTYAGVLRVFPFVVRECSEYRERGACRPDREVGFGPSVRELAAENVN